MRRADMTAAIGGTAIAALTLVSASYLLVSILSRSRRQRGGSRLRVRFLVGIVTSDMIIGLVALPAEAIFVARRPIRTGTAACDAQAWIYTTTIFAQNLWSAAIAFATFMLLKHPLHPVTAWLERHSLLVWVLLWGVSILHSGIWYATIGFINTTTLCSYASRRGRRLDRDLMHFVPRAVVFVIIVFLYSHLFSFLRRPDTIEIPNEREEDEDGLGARGTGEAKAGALAMLASCARRSYSRLRGPRPPRPPRPPQPVYTDAPWEHLSFMQIAQYGTTMQYANHRAESQGANRNSRSTPSPSHRPSPSPSLSLSASSSPGPSLSPSPGLGPGPPAPPPTPQSTTRHPRAPPDHPCVPEAASTPASEGSTQVSAPACSLCAMVGAALGGEDMKYDECEATVEAREAEQVEETEEAQRDHGAQGAAAGEQAFTLCEFLHHGDDAPPARLPARTDTHLSASAYFNRQASLLMLWFPLAYMVAFSVSLLRLVYDMVHTTPSPPLRVIGAWMVLGIGLADAAVFGIAEVFVRRRVRREMPDHLA